MLPGFSISIDGIPSLVPWKISMENLNLTFRAMSHAFPGLKASSLGGFELRGEVQPKSGGSGLPLRSALLDLWGDVQSKQLGCRGASKIGCRSPYFFWDEHPANHTVFFSWELRYQGFQGQQKSAT